MWPDFTPELLKRAFPKGSLLEGTEAALWQSLGQMPASHFETAKGKQLVVRRALRDLGLEWVATNTTPFRITVGNLFDAAAAHHRSNSNNDRTTTKRRKRSQILPDIQIQDESVREITNLQGPLLNQRKGGKPSCFSTEQRQAVRHQLDSQGVCVVRRAVPSRVAQAIAGDVTEQCLKPKAKTAKLAETTGNGVAGTPPSIYRDLPPATAGQRRELQDALWDLLLGTGSGNETIDAEPSRKDILLLYGHNAQNWAHQDNNREEVPIQAMLMLSDPQCDFEGGEFYVARRQDTAIDDDNNDEAMNIGIQRNIAPLENAGDLLLFQAGKKTGWWHGMLPARRRHQRSTKDKDEASDVYIRRAVGMLQPA